MFSFNPDSIKHFFTGNTTMKLLCLLVAFCIWGTSHIRKEARAELLLPVEIRNIPPGFSPLTTPQGQIHISLSGPAGLLEKVKENNPTMVFSLQGSAAPGKTAFHHLDANLKLPAAVRVISISPATVQIELVKR